MTKKENPGLEIAILIFFLVACSGRADVTMQNGTPSETARSITATSQIPIEKSKKPTLTVVATILPTVSPTYPLSTETPTIEKAPSVEQNCFNVLSTLPPDHSYQGLIALMSIQGHSYQLYDLSNGRMTTIPGEKNFRFSISPNRMLYAYEDGQEKKLKIFSSDGSLLNSIDWEENWGRLSQWQNDQTVLIEVTNLIDQTWEEYPRTLIALDAITGERKILSPEYPDIDHASASLDWGGLGTTAYDPGLTKVVYPGVIIARQEMGYILFDTVRKIKLLELPSPNFASIPRWFYDGTKFAVKGANGEIFIVTQAGEVSQLTHMNSNGYKFDIDHYDWSPTGKYLAMWLHSLESATASLAIVDTQSGEVMDLCILPGYNPMFLPYVPLPIWSPDGNTLMVEANFDSKDNGRDVILIDLENSIAYRILTNFVPVGWLANP